MRARCSGLDCGARYRVLGDGGDLPDGTTFTVLNAHIDFLAGGGVSGHTVRLADGTEQALAAPCRLIRLRDREEPTNASH